MQDINKFYMYCAYYDVEYTSNLLCLYPSFFWEVFELCCMVQLVFSPSREKNTPMNVVGITNI